MQQLDLPDMPTKLFACTPSRLATFTDCPRRYRLVYVDRPSAAKDAPWAHNTVGAAVHLALRQWWELPRRRRTPAAAGARLEEVWRSDGFRDQAQAEAWRERARGWVESYVATLDPGDEPVGVERGVAVRTARLAVSGRIDRLDERGGELVVVDYKTGRHVLSADDARGSLALALYALAAERTMRRPCRQVELHHLPSGTVVRWVHTTDSLQRHVGRAEGTAQDIELASQALSDGAHPNVAFPPRLGRHCGWCDYRSSCPEGSAAAPPRESWSMLAEEPA